jgi:hypothetical protein
MGSDCLEGGAIYRLQYDISSYREDMGVYAYMQLF